MLRCLTMVILLLLLGAGVLAYQVLGAPPAPAPRPKVAAPAGSPTAPSTDPRPSSSFDQKVESFEKAASTGGKKPVELVLTQQEIASKVQQQLAARGSGDLRNVTVRLQEGGALITGDTNLAGMSVPVQAPARLSASGGMLAVTVTSVKTGNLDLPPVVRDQLIEGIERAVGLNDLQKIDVGIDVQSVQVTPDHARIAGVSR